VDAAGCGRPPVACGTCARYRLRHPQR
jgi:hypothetical protein